MAYMLNVTRHEAARIRHLGVYTQTDSPGAAPKRGRGESAVYDVRIHTDIGKDDDNGLVVDDFLR